MLNGKVKIIDLIVGLIKKTLLYKMGYSPASYTHIKNKIKVEVDLSNHATKYNLKNATGVDTSKFAENIDLASLKWNTDELDINELETTPVDLSKLSDAVKNEVFKKAVYDELVKIVNAIQATCTDLV